MNGASVTLAKISRGPDELRVSIEAHPRTGQSIVMLAHVRADGSPGPRAPLQAHELDQVVNALKIASQTLSATRGGKHRTIRASEAELELDRKLF